MGTEALAKGRGKFDMLCDDTAGRHWYKLATGNGNFGASRHWLSGWCGHGGSYTQWADINGDGKADILCDDTRGRHWVKLSRGNGHFTNGRYYMVAGVAIMVPGPTGLTSTAMARQ